MNRNPNQIMKIPYKYTCRLNACVNNQIITVNSSRLELKIIITKRASKVQGVIYKP